MTSFVYLYNIPSDYHARHLRNFFSQYVESDFFSCFHFRHRPEILVKKSPITQQDLLEAIRDKKRNKSKLCTILSMPERSANEFCMRFNETHWLSTGEEEISLADQCHVSIIHSSDLDDNNALKRLLEFNPPSGMPKGNVGTPTAHFFEQIKTCQLEGSIINKLHLTFGQSGLMRTYGEVPYAYDSSVTATRPLPNVLHIPHELRSRSGTLILDHDEYMDYLEFKVNASESEDSKPLLNVASPSPSNDEHDDTDDLPDAEAEEWDRFEALHDDPYKVERRDKANIKYEDKIELVWEKGGSGLVFHTDERTWRKLDPLRKEEFFDEPASFDWDVDMEPYEEATELSVGPTPTGHWGSARDTTDLIHMQRIKENLHLPRSGLDKHELYRLETSNKPSGYGLMQRMGWRPGMRLGRGNGLLNPSGWKPRSIQASRDRLPRTPSPSGTNALYIYRAYRLHSLCL